MAVLYRKYRPQTFAGVVGQKSIIKTLQNQISGGVISHAYLFVGSRGVGKTSVARIFAKAINCKNQQPSLPRSESGHLPQKGEKDIVQASPDALGDACGECDACQAIQNGNFIDLIEIDAASNTGVDNIRELIEHVKFSPASGKYKVFIIDEVHMLSKGAFNALLKTLEEPPQHAIFILATTEIAKVPATIISRTQRFDFKRYSLPEIEGHLQEICSKENIHLPREAIRLIAEHSQGGLRDALSLLDKVFTLGSAPALEEVLQLIGITDTGLLEKLMGYIVNGQSGEIPGFLESLIEKGVDFSVFNRDFLEYLRKILIIKITGQPNVETADEGYLSKSKTFAAVLPEGDIIHITRLFLRSLKEQALAPSPDLPVLLAAVEAAMRKANGNPKKAGESPAAEQAVIANTASRPVSQPKIEVLQSAVSLAETPEEAVNPVDLSKEALLENWPKVIDALKEINGPLAHLLKSSPVEGLRGGRVAVGVKYKFHKQNLEHSKNQEVIRKILKQIYGFDMALVGEVRASEEDGLSPAPALSEALKVFGGELIE